MTLREARVSEACNLTVRDVVLARGTALLRKTKNGKARRVTLLPKLIEPLRQWMVSQELSWWLGGHLDRR